MPKKDDDLAKHTLNLYAGDYAALQDLYPDVGAAVIIRRIVRSFVQQCEKNGASISANIEINI